MVDRGRALAQGEKAESAGKKEEIENVYFNLVVFFFAFALV